MAKREDKDAAKKGFQIPIEDAGETAEESAEKAEEAEAAEAAGAPEPTEGAIGGEEAPSSEQAESECAEDGEGVGEADAAAESVEDELIAEAEAIVEEASAAEQLEAAQAKAQDWQDRYMRLHAEWDTYRRRTQEQRAEERERATEKLMESLLPVLDDFERTVAYAEENGEQGLLDGVKAVRAKLADTLAKGGLETIDPAGEPYDALEAQAVQMVPDGEAFEETVRDVYQKGYKMGKKVLRAAMVTVTTGGPKRPKEDEGSEG